MTTPTECAEQILALADKATPDPWTSKGTNWGGMSWRNYEVLPDDRTGARKRVCQTMYGNDPGSDDAEFIAQIRQLAPEAARHIRELQDTIDSYAKTQVDLAQRLAMAQQSLEAWKETDVGKQDQLIRELVRRRNELQERWDGR